MLDRFTLQDDGTATAQVPLNIPGYPVAVRDGGDAVFTVEPTPRAAESDNTGPVAVLYRLRVKETEARIEASRDLEGRFGSLRVIGDRAFYLRLGSLFRTCDLPEGEGAH